MHKAVLALSRSSLFSHFGGGVAAVSVRMQDGSPRGARQGMVTKAAQAGEDPKAEVSSTDEETDSRMHPDTRKAYRVSERVANFRSRMQQGLVSLKLNTELGSKRIKTRSDIRNKPEQFNTRICTGMFASTTVLYVRMKRWSDLLGLAISTRFHFVCPFCYVRNICMKKIKFWSYVVSQLAIDFGIDLSESRENTEAAFLAREALSSAVVSLECTSSVQPTPPAKRRKRRQTLVDVIPPPGARLSSGVECVPPVSPFGLIQEYLYQDPWKVLVACILLNQTRGLQMHKVIWDLFELCPDAETCVSTEKEKIGRVIHSLGLQNKKAETLQRFSQDFLGTTWTNVTQLHGIGEYARDAYAIFCEGRWQDVQPKDLVLSKYWRWLDDTQGLGYGFSQIQ